MRWQIPLPAGSRTTAQQPLSGWAEAPGYTSAPWCAPLPPLSGRAEAPGYTSAPWCAPLPPLSGRAEAPGYASAPWCAPLPPLSGRAKAPGYTSAPWCAPLPPLSGRAEAPGYSLAPWCARRQHRGPGPFTRRLPPGGSLFFPPRFPSCHFSLLTSHFHLLSTLHSLAQPPVAIRTLVRIPASGVTSA
ncbi:MAG: hypothetical protein RLZZ436_1186 [Planctomycetota bacterium]